VISGVLAQLNAMRGDFDEARDLYGRARSMLSDLGASVTAASTSTESSRVEILAGDLAAAERELRRDHALLTELGEQYYLSTVAAILAGVLEARGQLTDAEALSRSAETLADEDDVFSQVAWRGARARVLARTDHPDEAERLAREAVAMAARTVDISLHADALVDLGNVLTTLGRAAEADASWSEALALYERKEDLVSSRQVRSRLAGTVPA
jgi:ATP/maltotriose-dependent transcriptional regulator MalT